MIRTAEEIELIISKCSGTHVKRNNLRRKLVCQTNDEITERINSMQKEIRKLKADGFTQQDLRGLYANITKLEVQML